MATASAPSDASATTLKPPSVRRSLMRVLKNPWSSAMSTLAVTSPNVREDPLRLFVKPGPVNGFHGAQVYGHNPPRAGFIAIPFPEERHLVYPYAKAHNLLPFPYYYYLSRRVFPFPVPGIEDPADVTAPH